MVVTPQQLDQLFAQCCPWMDGSSDNALEELRLITISQFLVAVHDSHEATGVYPYAAILRMTEDGRPFDLYDTAQAAALAAKEVKYDMESAETRPSDDSVFFIIEENGRVKCAAWFVHLKKSHVYRLAEHACSKVKHGGLETVLTLTKEEFRRILKDGG